MNEIIFWNVDTQKDFMLKEGKLYIPGAEEIIPNLRILTELANKLNIRVVNTADFHGKGDEELSATPDFKNTFPEHCMVGTEGQAFIDETIPIYIDRSYYIQNYGHTLNLKTMDKARNVIIHKNKFDVFQGNPWTDTIIKQLAPQMVVVYGVATDVCVKFAVDGLLARNFKVLIVKDAIKGLGDCKKLIKDWNNGQVKTIRTSLLKDLLTMRN